MRTLSPPGKSVARKVNARVSVTVSVTVDTAVFATLGRLLVAINGRGPMTVEIGVCTTHGCLSTSSRAFRREGNL